MRLPFTIPRLTCILPYDTFYLMGISIGHNWSCSTYDRPAQDIFPPPVSEKIVERVVVVEKPLPNPNPKKYKVLNYTYDGKYLIVLVNYPDCTNYEGNKILMFENVHVEDLFNQGSIDPHFSNNSKKISPIARFEPTLRGWEMALKLARIQND